jgi:protein ECT2
MVLSTSPRKAVPLASGDDWVQSSPSKVAVITRRVFFCGVVAESEGGKEISEGALHLLVQWLATFDIQADVQELLESLGEPLGSQSDTDTVQSRSVEKGDDDSVSYEI